MVIESDRQGIWKKKEGKPSHVGARAVQPCSPAARESFLLGRVCLAVWLAGWLATGLAAALFLEELAATPAKLRSSGHLSEGGGVSWLAVRVFLPLSHVGQKHCAV